MKWLANYDPLQIQALEKMPIIDYFLLLDKKIASIKKQKSHA